MYIEVGNEGFRWNRKEREAMWERLEEGCEVTGGEEEGDGEVGMDGVGGGCCVGGDASGGRMEGSVSKDWRSVRGVWVEMMKIGMVCVEEGVMWVEMSVSKPLLNTTFRTFTDSIHVYKNEAKCFPF